MKKCKACQKEIDDKAKKCPHCQTDQRNWFARYPIMTGLLGLIVFIVIISATGSSGSNSKSSNVSSDVKTREQDVKEETTKIEDPNPHFRDGNYEVGKDIQPGTYRTRTGYVGCYFARLSGFTGALSEILSNENTDAPAVVTITENDKGFTSKRCGIWTQDLSQITKDRTTFENGTYIVGTDIVPGTYRSTGGTGCYFARLSGFTGGLSHILSNENTDDPAIVTITPSDKGFTARRCGTWTKN